MGDWVADGEVEAGADAGPGDEVDGDGAGDAEVEADPAAEATGPESIRSR